jgi:plastocyanin
MFAMVSLSQAESGDKRLTKTQQKSSANRDIRIMDQNGNPAVSGVPSPTGQIVDVSVGPGFVFVPDTVNISAGDTVRWTWAGNGHSVTSGDPCTVDGQFCSPDDMNCDQGILSGTGTVYEHTFDQAGTYNYFCFADCNFGMTGVVNVAAGPTPTPTPNANGHAHGDSDTFGNAYSNADSNSFRNAIGHTNAYTNGDAHRFTNTRWKAAPDTAVAPNTTPAPHAVTGKAQLLFAVISDRL